MRCGYDGGRCRQEVRSSDMPRVAATLALGTVTLSVAGAESPIAMPWALVSAGMSTSKVEGSGAVWICEPALTTSGKLTWAGPGLSTRLTWLLAAGWRN